MTTTISPIWIKSGTSALAASVLDRWVCGEDDMTQNAYFGVAVGAGVGVGSYISSLTPALLPDSAGLYTGKGVMDRTFEIGGGLAASYIISKYMTKQNNETLTNKLLCVVVLDFIGEYIKDYITSQPVAFSQ